MSTRQREELEMAKSVNTQAVYERLACAGPDGVVYDPKGLVKKWGFDTTCVAFAATVELLVKGRRARFVPEEVGDGRRRTRLQAVTVPV